MLRRDRRQPRLLDTWLTTLRRDRGAAPPAGLDADVADLAARLQRDLRSLDISGPFAAQLRRRLDAEADALAAADGGQRAWSGPALDTRRRPSQPPTTLDDEETAMPQIDGTAEPVPIPLHERRWLKEVLKIAAAALVFGIVGALLVLALRGDDGGQPGSAPPTATAAATAAATPTAVATEAAIVPASPTATAPAPTATTPPTPTFTLPVSGSVAATIPVGQWPGRMAVGAGSLWVANSNDGSVARIDPATNTVIATIPVASPGNNTADALAADDTAVWVDASLQLVRIDPATNQVVASFTPEVPVDWLAVGHGAVWALSYDGNQLLRIDPGTNTVTTAIPVETPRDMVVTTDAVWILRDLGNSGASEVLKIDPATTSVAATVSLEGEYGELLRAEGETLWISTAGGLVQLDAATSRIVTTIPYPAQLFGPPMIAAGDGKVWACQCTGSDDVVAWQLESSTGEWSAQLPVGTQAGDTWLLYFEDALWRSHSDENTVTRITLAD